MKNNTVTQLWKCTRNDKN